jgi:prevent-host-death family protein
MSVWQVQVAKAKFSELLRAAREQGPQTISVRGKEEFVVLTREAYEAAAPKRQMTWDELFAPIQALGGVDLELPPREPELPRDIGLDDD